MSQQNADLLHAFRTSYHSLASQVEAAIHNGDDSTVVARLGDRVDEILQAVEEVSIVAPHFQF